MNDKDFLEHYGKLGMRWGKRGASQVLSKVGAKIKSEFSNKDSEDFKKAKTLKKKKLSRMSNAEIRSLNERMQLERQYKDLTKPAINPGKKFVSDVLSNSAKQTASTYVSKYMTKGVDVLLKKAMK